MNTTQINTNKKFARDHRLNQQLFKLSYSIDSNDVDEHDIQFYTQMVRIQDKLNIKLGNYIIIEEKIKK